MSLNVFNRNNRPRYGFVRRDDRGSPDALYDIVDNKEGAERVLAWAVRHEPTLQIVGALNAQEELKRISKDWN